jgi:hypothetical protein
MGFEHIGPRGKCPEKNASLRGVKKSDKDGSVPDPWVYETVFSEGLVPAVF